MREYGQLYFLVRKRVLPEPGKPKAENGSHEEGNHAERLGAEPDHN